MRKDAALMPFSFREQACAVKSARFGSARRTRKESAMYKKSGARQRGLYVLMSSATTRNVTQR